MKDRTEILTESEIITLKKELRSNYFLSLTVFMMAIVIFHLIILVKTGRWTLPTFEIIAILGIATITFLATFLTRQLRSELEQGQKIIEFKTIEEKHEYMDRQDRMSPEYKKYELTALGQRFVVTEEQYKSAEISDLIAVHKTPLREVTLGIEIEKITSP